MELANISCKCPACGESFQISDALEEQVLDSLREQLVSENDAAVSAKLEQAREEAKREGKNEGVALALEKVKKKQIEADSANEQLNQLKLAQIEKDAELSRLKEDQDAAVALRLAELKSELQANFSTDKKALELQIEKIEIRSSDGCNTGRAGIHASARRSERSQY